jgi:hypothetical protein
MDADETVQVQRAPAIIASTSAIALVLRSRRDEWIIAFELSGVKNEGRR